MNLPSLRGLVLRDLVFFHDPRVEPRPSWWIAVLLAVVVGTGVGALSVAGRLAPPRTLTPGEKHRNWSLEIAANRVLCDAPSRLSTSFELAEQLESHPELQGLPLQQVIRDATGSLGAYCRTVNEPFLNGENSLMLQMALFLGLDHELSLRGLGWRLQAVKVLALAFAAYVLLSNGASLLFTGVVFCSGLAIIGQMTTKFYSVYPFAPVLLLLAAALASLAAQHARALGGPGLVAVASLFGWLTAFAANMRSSHLPVYLAFATLYLAAAGRVVAEAAGDRGPRLRARVLSMAAGAAGFCAAYALFGWLLIRPLTSEPARAGQASPHHVIAHPLVLGLAVPENALSRAEGIRWDDRVGLTLARRVDPGVTYLQEGYETALFAYYRRLWRQHPGEMLKIYLEKLRVSGADMISKLWTAPRSPTSGRVAHVALWPLAWLHDGALLLVVYAGVCGAALTQYLRRSGPFALTVALMTLAGAALQIEATLIYSLFDMTHSASQLLCFLFLAALTWQAALEGLRVAVRIALRRARSARSA